MLDHYRNNKKYAHLLRQESNRIFLKNYSPQTETDERRFHFWFGFTGEDIGDLECIKF